MPGVPDSEIVVNLSLYLMDYCGLLIPELFMPHRQCHLYPYLALASFLAPNLDHVDFQETMLQPNLRAISR